MTQYRILPPAREELRNASRWYEQQRDGLGHALIDEFEERLALALAHPQAGTVVGSTTQGLPIRRPAASVDISMIRVRNCDTPVSKDHIVLPGCARRSRKPGRTRAL